MRPSRRKELGAVGVAALLAIAPLGAALAQNVSQSSGALGGTIAAVVNDDVISSFDLIQRIRLISVTAGVQLTQENLPQLQQEALRQLVDERLQLQEIRRVEKQQKMELAATDRDIDAQIAEIAKGNNMSAAQLVESLNSQGVGSETFRSELRAELSWQAWIQGRYGSRLRIGDDQVRAYQRRVAESASKPQYQVSEVFLDASRVGGIEQATNGAQQLIAQMQQGAAISAVARQFSASPSAANGGDLGWINEGELPGEVDKALAEMRPGQISQPIPVKDGVYIIQLRDRRAAANALVVDLKQAAVSLPADASPDQLKAATAKLEALRGQIKGCDDLEAVAGKVDGVLAGDLGEAEVKDLSPAFQQVANTLQPGQVSHPVRSEAGLHLVAVCSKRQSGAEALTNDQVETRLRGEQMAVISRRYLRDLRNSATIETR